MSIPDADRKKRTERTVEFQQPWIMIGVSRFLDLTYVMPRRQPIENKIGKSLGDKCAAAKKNELRRIASGVGIYLVREVRMKPLNIVSSSSGAKTPVTAMRLIYDIVSKLII